MKEMGRIFDAVSSTIARATFHVITADQPRIEDGKDASDVEAHLTFIGEATGADELFGLGIIKNEAEHGHDVYILHNPEDDIQLPQ